MRAPEPIRSSSASTILSAKIGRGKKQRLVRAPRGPNRGPRGLHSASLAICERGGALPKRQQMIPFRSSKKSTRLPGQRLLGGIWKLIERKTPETRASELLHWASSRTDADGSSCRNPSWQTARTPQRWREDVQGDSVRRAALRHEPASTHLASEQSRFLAPTRRNRLPM